MTSGLRSPCKSLTDWMALTKWSNLSRPQFSHMHNAKLWECLAQYWINVSQVGIAIMATCALNANTTFLSWFKPEDSLTSATQKSLSSKEAVPDGGTNTKPLTFKFLTDAVLWYGILALKTGTKVKNYFMHIQSGKNNVLVTLWWKRHFQMIVGVIKNQ